MTNEIIEKAKTPNGGWTAKKLAIVGIPWPPKRGWKIRLIGRNFPEKTIKAFIAARGSYLWDR